MDITIIHKPLNREEIAALTPTVLYDSPRGGYRPLGNCVTLRRLCAVSRRNCRASRADSSGILLFLCQAALLARQKTGWSFCKPWTIRSKRQNGWQWRTHLQKLRRNAVSPGGVIWVAIFLYLFFRCFGCFDSDRMTFDPTPSAPQGEVRK